MVNITITPPIVKVNHFDGCTDYMTMKIEKRALLMAIKAGTDYTVSAELNNWLKYTDPELYFVINP